MTATVPVDAQVGPTPTVPPGAVLLGTTAMVLLAVEAVTPTAPLVDLEMTAMALADARVAPTPTVLPGLEMIATVPLDAQVAPTPTVPPGAVLLGTIAMDHPNVTTIATDHPNVMTIATDRPNVTTIPMGLVDVLETIVMGLAELVMALGLLLEPATATNLVAEMMTTARTTPPLERSLRKLVEPSTAISCKKRGPKSDTKLEVTRTGVATAMTTATAVPIAMTTNGSVTHLEMV